MKHKGVDYSLTRSETPDIWNWRFRIGNLARSGSTEARLPQFVIRRVQSKIDRELRHAGHVLTPHELTS